MKTKAAVFSLCALAAMMPQAASQVEARENSLSGGGSISYETYDKSGGNAQGAGQANGNDNYSRVIISPVLTVKSLGDKNSIELTYSPSLSYGDGDNGDLQQSARISANWSPTSRWTVALSDNYQQTDTDLNNINRAGFTQPVATPGGQEGNGAAGGSQTSQGPQTSQTASNSQLTNQPGRQKYTDNALTADATYQYWEDSFFKFGYALDLLRYDDLVGSNQNFDRHTFSASIKHRLNSQYSLAAAGSYVKGISDQAGQAAANTPSQDVDEYHVSTSIESLTIPHHPLSLTYSLDISNYDDERQADSQIHTLLLGWTWQINPKAAFSLSGGPIYEKSDNDGSWSYALNASYSHQWSATGQIAFTVSHGMESRNFSGSQADNGMV
jgi:hypothetical protein